MLASCGAGLHGHAVAVALVFAAGEREHLAADEAARTMSSFHSNPPHASTTPCVGADQLGGGVVLDEHADDLAVDDDEIERGGCPSRSRRLA